MKDYVETCVKNGVKREVAEAVFILLSILKYSDTNERGEQMKVFNIIMAVIMSAVFLALFSIAVGQILA